MHLDKYKQYNGRLTTGDNAMSHPVKVRLSRNGIEIDATPFGASDISTPPAKPRQVWNYADLTSGVPVTHRSEEVLISDLKQPGATLFVADADFAATLANMSPQIGARAWRMVGLKPAGGITVSVASLIGLIYATGYSPAKTVANIMPEQARSMLGQKVITSMTKKRKVCKQRAGRLALDAMMKRLSDAAGLEKPFKVTVVNWSLVNAFAAPGGHLVLTSGLIRKASSADMVAGVMAHEMGHGIELHPEAGLVRALGMSAAGEFFFTGSSSALKNIGFVLATLSYTRNAENEADQHALNILKNAGVSSKPLSDFFDTIAKKSKKSSIGKVMKKYRFLSTHPPSPERAKLFGAKPSYATTAVISPSEWRSLRIICGKKYKKKKYGRFSRLEREANRTKRLLESLNKQSEILNNDPSNVLALRKRASTYSRLNKLDKAIADISKVIELEPGNASDYKKRGFIYRKQKNYAKAAIDQSEAIRLQPNSFANYKARARTYVKLKQFDKAIGDYTHAIALAPKDVTLLQARVNLHIKQKHWDDAIWDYNTIIALRPSYSTYYVSRGIAKRGKGDFEDALTDINLALKKSPKSIRAFLERGRTRFAMGQDEDAIADFSQAVTLRPEKLDTRMELGLAYERVNDRIAAISTYRELLAVKYEYHNSLKTKKRRGIHRTRARKRLRALNSSE